MSVHILNPIKNDGRSRLSNFIKITDKSVTYIIVSVIADQPLVLNVYQAFNTDFYDIKETVEYTNIGNETTFGFMRIGTTAYFTLTNTSSANCTYTRAFADYRNEFPKPILDKLNVLSNKLDEVNTNLLTLNKQGIEIHPIRAGGSGYRNMKKRTQRQKQKTADKKKHKKTKRKRRNFTHSRI